MKKVKTKSPPSIGKVYDAEERAVIAAVERADYTPPRRGGSQSACQLSQDRQSNDE